MKKIKDNADAIFGYGYEPEPTTNKPVVLRGKLENNRWFCGQCDDYLYDGHITKDIATIIPIGGTRIIVKYKEIAALCGNCYSTTRQQVINYLATDEELEYKQDIVTEEDNTLLAKLEELIQSKEFKNIKDGQKQREYLERKIAQILS